jgi:hypothetical protein
VCSVHLEYGTSVDLLLHRVLQIIAQIESTLRPPRLLSKEKSTRQSFRLTLSWPIFTVSAYFSQPRYLIELTKEAAASPTQTSLVDSDSAAAAMAYSAVCDCRRQVRTEEATLSHLLKSRQNRKRLWNRRSCAPGIVASSLRIGAF